MCLTNCNLRGIVQHVDHRFHSLLPWRYRQNQPDGQSERLLRLDESESVSEEQPELNLLPL
jgi:hypothetical protein